MTNPRPIRVLVVEDNPGDARLAREYVLQTGYDVNITTVDDGQQAIDLFDPASKRSDGPDLVLLDLNLPKRSGHHVLDHIRRQDAHLKVLIYSGSKSPEEMGKAKTNGADGYLVKPMTVDEMDAVVEELRAILATVL
jgi:DNA-binding response OmpR family regulator